MHKGIGMLNDGDLINTDYNRQFRPHFSRCVSRAITPLEISLLASYYQMKAWNTLYQHMIVNAY